MKDLVRDLHFEDTYYLANIVEAIVTSTFDYLRFFDEIWGEDRIIGYHVGFSPRKSSLQMFIQEICYRVYWELTSEVEYSEIEYKKSYIPSINLKIDSLIARYSTQQITYTSWLENNESGEPSDYFASVSDQLEEVFEEMSYEVFHILFQNRAFLQNYNKLLADSFQSFFENGMQEIRAEDKKYYSSKGYLKRVNIPKWVQRTIFFRDRGRCVYCLADLSGRLSLLTEENFDHIIPLAQFGSNDVSNIQLCCRTCNNKKLKKIIPPSSKYEKWF